MKITELKMKNFRGFEDKTIEFSEGFNVLVGDNGKGKTAILEGLTIGMATYFKEMEGDDFRIPLPKDVFHSSKKVGYILIPTKQFPTEIHCNLKFNATAISTGIKLRQSSTLGKMWDKKPNFVISPDGILAPSKELYIAVAQGEEKPLPILCYYGVERFQSNKSSNVSEHISRFNGYRDCLNRVTDHRDFLNWYKKVLLLGVALGYEQEVKNSVQHTISTVIPECKIIGLDENAEDLQATLNVNGAEQLLPFKLLSDGYRNMLAMVADIAYRCAVLNPQLGEKAPLETHGMVLIDEVDLHLHPKWQRSVVGDLKKAFPNIQFVVTTHSPFILQSAEGIANVINLDTDISGTIEGRSLEDVAEDHLGVENVYWSIRRKNMFEAAKKYYAVLEEAKDADPDELDRLKQELDELSQPYTGNVAFAAFLESKRIAAGLGETENK